MPTYDIFTNHDCNLACTYCFERFKEQRVNAQKDCCDFLESCYRRDALLKEGVIVSLIGGESLLHSELCDAIAEKANELDEQYHTPVPFNMQITTNGTLFEQPKVYAFLKKWHRHLTLGFSIDGTKENHDACRVDHAGNGSYDRAVRGLNIVRKFIPPCRISVKATFTHATLHRYAESVINLIALGFTSISANGVYEENWKDEDAEAICPQLDAVTDYLFEHNLENTVHLWQLNREGLNLAEGVPYGQISQNYCGTCAHMRTLGFDRQLYGCHRFATMQQPMAVGVLTADNRQVITNTDLINSASNFWRKRPEKCLKCGLGQTCPACVVAAYEYDRNNPEVYYETFSQCGWATAMYAARLYFRERLLKRKERNK